MKKRKSGGGANWMDTYGDMVIDAVRSGAKDFIVKPFKADRVLKTVNSIVGNP